MKSLSLNAVRSAHSSTVADEVGLRDAHAVDLDGACPEWVELVPAGTFAGRDGRGPYVNRDPQSVVDRSMAAARGGQLMIDCGHAIEQDGYEGNAAEAAGWITELRVTNGIIEGKVAWTPLGREKVGNRQYRWLSPVFYHDGSANAQKGGVVQRLEGAGLTNRPNLALKALNTSHQEPSLSDKLKAAMTRIRAIFGLPETTDEDATVARVQAAFDAEQVVTKVSQSLKIATTASADDVVKAINTAASTPDVTKFVSKEQFTTVSDRLSAMVKAEGERIVGAAVEAGKIQPPLKQHYLDAHARDPEGTKALIDKMVPVVAPGTEGRQKPGEKITTLDAESKAMCARLGLKEEDYLRELNAQEGRK